jgi:outer membrane protein assembly factor BamB
VREVVAECLRRDPAARPTAHELAQRLEPVPEIPRHGWLPPAVTALVPAHPATTPPMAGPTEGSVPDAATVSVPAVPRLAEPSPPPRTGLSRRGLLLGAGAVAVVTGVGAGIGLALRPQESPAVPVPPPTVPDRPSWSTRVDGAVRALALGDGFVCAAGLGSQLHVLDQGTGQVRWSHTVRRQVLSPPAVLGGRIGVADSESLYVIDAASGALLWESEFASLPQAAGDLLLAGRYDGNDRTALVALDPAGGQVRWSAPALSASSMTESPIAVGDGTAFAVLGTAVTAIDLGTGQPRWQVGTGLDGFSASRLMLTGPVDGLVLLTVPSGTHGNGEFIALDAATGAVRWRRAPQYGVSSAPVVDGGVVVFQMGGGSSVVGWDLATGDDRWTREGLASDGWGAIKTLVAAAAGASYFGGENRVYGDDGYSVLDAAGEPTYQSRLYAFDSATGETRWQLTVDATYHVRSPLVADQGLVVLGTEDGTIHAVRT